MGAITKITIAKKGYAVDFPYGAIKELGVFLNETTYDGTVQRVAVAVEQLQQQEKNGGNLPFETLDVLGYLIISGIRQEHELQHEEVVNAILLNVGALQPILEKFMQQMPLSNNAKNTAEPKPQKKRKVKAA